jgi:hypothetical protein
MGIDEGKTLSHKQVDGNIGVYVLMMRGICLCLDGGESGNDNARFGT